MYLDHEGGVSDIKMGADWYFPFVVYGYILSHPTMTFREILKDLHSLQSDPFECEGMLVEFHSRMEGMDDEEREQMDQGAIVVIGFRPSADLNKTCEMAEKLKVFVESSPELSKYTYTEPSFHTGISWWGY